MDKNFVIKHMNGEHGDCVLGLFLKYGGSKTDVAKLVDYDFEGLWIEGEGEKGLEKIRVPFATKVQDASEIQGAIVALCKSLRVKEEDILKEAKEFIDEFKSVIIASVDKDGYGVASYSAYVKHQNNLYIYISQASEHYYSITANPDKLEILFIQDESQNKNIIARKRLTYKASAIHVPRDSDEFKVVIADYIKFHKNDSGVEQITQMRDFQLFKLKFGKGRFVKGFGAAFDIDGDKVSFPHSKNPHSFKK